VAEAPRIGASPDAARQRAVQLYPALAPMLSRKRDQHRADALLLACYGRHRTVASDAAGDSKNTVLLAAESSYATFAADRGISQ
jgi:hypothetical protein